MPISSNGLIQFLLMSLRISSNSNRYYMGWCYSFVIVFENDIAFASEHFNPYKEGWASNNNINEHSKPPVTKSWWDPPCGVHHQLAVIFCERVEWECTLMEPERWWLCLSMVKLEEPLVEAHSNIDVQISCVPLGRPAYNVVPLRVPSLGGKQLSHS